MPPDEAQARRIRRDPLQRLSAVQTAARGWREAQLAILGLLGIVGVVKSDTLLSALPDPVRYVALCAVLTAFVGALVGALMFTRAAWPPLDSRLVADPDAEDRQLNDAVRTAQRRTKIGYVATVVAAVAMAAAFSLAWWPPSNATGPRPVRVSTSTGPVCGTLRTSTGNFLVIRVSGQDITVPMDRVMVIEPTTSCT